MVNRAGLGMEVMHERNAHNFPLDLAAAESPLLWLCRLLPSVDLESTNDSDQLNRKAPSSEGAFCRASSFLGPINHQ